MQILAKKKIASRGGQLVAFRRNMAGLFIALCADYLSPAKQWALDHHLAVLQVFFHVARLSRDDLLVLS